MASGDWYYVQDGERAGPVSGEEIARLLEGGTLSPRSLIWREGLEGWQQAGAHFDAPQRTPPSPVPGAPPPMPGVGDVPRTGTSRGAASDQGGPAGEIQTGADGLYIGAPARGFTEAIGVCLSSYFTFSGRASRSEYWYFFLFGVLAGLVTGFLDSILFGVTFDSEDFGPLNGLTSLVLLIPSLAVGWRRLHDIDRSGWWIGGFFIAIMLAGVMIGMAAVSGGLEGMIGMTALLGIGALIYTIVMLVFLCTRGNPGPNRFG